MFKERANPFAKETPTSKDPINPGPRVKATALNSSLVTPARFNASCTTGTMFCWCAREANSVLLHRMLHVRLDLIPHLTANNHP